jgi:glycine/D-amino acid oxidase-like deaminating enzyme
MALWHELKDLLGDDGGFRVAGQVQIAETDTEMARLEARARTVRELGYRHEELIDRPELMRLLPALKPCAGVGGLVWRDDGFASPYRTTLAFAAGARAAWSRRGRGWSAWSGPMAAGGFGVPTAAPRGRRNS